MDSDLLDPDLNFFRSSAVTSGTVNDQNLHTKHREINTKTDLNALLQDTPALCARTPGSEQTTYHSRTTAWCAGLKGHNVVVTGASRGIGQGIAVKFAMSGANVCVVGRSEGNISYGPGTLSDVVRQIQDVGGSGFAVPCDLSKQESIRDAAKTILSRFSEIDVLINNASNHFAADILHMTEKRYDLMYAVNVRGTFMFTQHMLPSMLSAMNPHVLTVAPAAIPDCTWLVPQLAYASAKIAMAYLSRVWDTEFPEISFNTLWPKYTVATFATSGNKDLAVPLGSCVTVAHMADPAYRIVTSSAYGRHFIDEDVLSMMGIHDVEPYKVSAGSELVADFFIDPEGLSTGQSVSPEQAPVVATADSWYDFRDKRVIVVGQVEELAAEMKAADIVADSASAAAEVDELVSRMDRLDILYVSCPQNIKCCNTMDTSASDWDYNFEVLCKDLFFCLQKTIPVLLAGGGQVVIESPSPIWSVSDIGLWGLAAVCFSIRSMYVVGLAHEYRGKVRCNAISFDDIMEASPLLLQVLHSESSGHFYSIRNASYVNGSVEEYAKQFSFIDFTSDLLLKPRSQNASTHSVLRAELGGW